MDFVTTTTGHVAKQPRVHHAAKRRKVYLDTYAKHRAVESSKPAARQPERQQQALASIPMSYDTTQHLKQPKKQRSPHTLRALSKRAITLTRAHYNVLARPQAPAVAAVVRQYPQPNQAPTQFNPSNAQQMEANLQALYQPSLTEQLQKSSTKSDNHIRTIMASALACGVLSLSVFAFVTRVDTQPVVAQPVGSHVIEVEVPTKQSQPKGKQAPVVSDFVARKPTDPVKIVISSIGVNAPVQGLGINNKGQIDVPKSYGVVGWYNKGKTVGEAGPTVLVGHYASGGGAVFDRLDGTKNGDLITVTTQEGKNYTYKITKKVQYPKDKVPMKQVFKSGDESRLEIITCQGDWSGSNYNNRLVVTAELVK